LAILFLVIGIIITILAGNSIDTLANENCAFCDERILQYQQFYEDDLVIVLYTHKPILPGHSLIIPKRHVKRFEMLSEEEIAQIGRVIKKVDQAAKKVFKTSSYLLLQKNGLEVGQTVPHVHFHYIPRKKGDDSTLKFFAKMYLANIKNPIPTEDMKIIVAEMKEMMETSPKESIPN